MDMYGLDEIEEEYNTQPTIEDVKKIVDSKRIKRSPSTTLTSMVENGVRLVCRLVMLPQWSLRLNLMRDSVCV